VNDLVREDLGEGVRPEVRDEGDFLVGVVACPETVEPHS
jgi:hypothetical protein